MHGELYGHVRSGVISGVRPLPAKYAVDASLIDGVDARVWTGSAGICCGRDGVIDWYLFSGSLALACGSVGHCPSGWSGFAVGGLDKFSELGVGPGVGSPQ